jgi:hypothetical protein
LVTGKENTLDTKIIPIGREVRKSNPPFLFACIWMAFIHKPVSIVGLTQVTFVVLSLMLISDLTVQLKKRWKESGGVIIGRGSWRRWD